ncbi:MAG: sulfurtransferase [Polyangiaceae bacterium]|nr:sulfurtransferase [Polyangiaceae bacterium]
MSQRALITPAEVADRLERGEPVLIVDTRDPEAYASGHLPGARSIREIFTYLAESTPEGLRALEDTFARLLGAAGASGDEEVVIYEDAMNSGFGQSCRGWFLLRWLGHPRVRVLDGGLRAWIAEGRPLETGAAAATPRTFVPRVDPALMVTRDDVLAAMEDPRVVMLDVRDRDEWMGESSSPYGKDFAPRKGRLPGARWIEWYEFMKTQDGIPRFRSPEEIRSLCARVGVGTGDKVILYCFKGARASNTLVAMQEAGFQDVRMYFGSWNEWSRDPALPIDEGAPDPARMATA